MSAHNTLEEAARSEFTLSDPGDGKTIASPSKQSGVVPLVTAAAETRSLADPARAGLQVTLAMQTDGGDCVVTASSAVNQTGNNTLTFADAGDEITLRAIKKGTALVWRVASNDGVALSTV